MEIKVSLIVPVYGVENYLERAVDSALGQTLQEKEVILVDDGSPDRCPQICDRYAREYPEVVRVLHQENQGLGMARNAGAALARGEDLLFLDSLIILQRIQKDPGLIRPLILNRRISFKKLAFCRVITLVLHICQQFLCPGAPLVYRQFSHPHLEKIPGSLQALSLLIRSHVDLKLFPLGCHDLIGQCLVHGFDPDPSEILAFSQIFPADNIFQFVDASDKVSVMDTLFLHLQEISFHSDLGS